MSMGTAEKHVYLTRAVVYVQGFPFCVVLLHLGLSVTRLVGEGVLDKLAYERKSLFTAFNLVLRAVVIEFIKIWCEIPLCSEGS